MKALLISDFSINNLSGCLKNELTEQKIEIQIAPFNQVHQVLLDETVDCWTEKKDIAILWAQPERVLKHFASLLNNEDVNLEIALEEVRKFAHLIKNASQRVSHFFVANWAIDSSLFYQGTSSNNSDSGIFNFLNQMNLVLSEELSKYPTIHILQTQKWLEASGAIAYSPKLWYLSKTPFHISVFLQAAKDISSAIRNVKTISKKVIIIDLDNTLWGGVVGDLGMENIILGGHNAQGEAFKDFQQALKSIVNKGVILAITSKNEESIAMNAIENHPEMVLRKKDFAAWRINWDDKAKNISEIAQELNIGLDSIVFLDDNPFERERIKHSFPEILVPDLPTDPLLYKRFLLQLDCFHSTSISKEDRARTEMYSIEKQRILSKNEFSNLEDWLMSIDIKVKCEPLHSDNLQRVLQLLNKTNQLNLSTFRYTEKELVERSIDVQNKTFAFYAKDNFGDAGLIGVLSFSIENERLNICDFVLSCRVIGRKIEETMISVAINFANQHRCTSVIAKYIPTEKNKPCFDFFKNIGFSQVKNLFIWETANPYIRPYFIELEMHDHFIP